MLAMRARGQLAQTQNLRHAMRPSQHEDIDIHDPSSPLQNILLASKLGSHRNDHCLIGTTGMKTHGLYNVHGPSALKRESLQKSNKNI